MEWHVTQNVSILNMPNKTGENRQETAYFLLVCTRWRIFVRRKAKSHLIDVFIDSYTNDTELFQCIQAMRVTA